MKKNKKANHKAPKRGSRTHKHKPTPKPQVTRPATPAPTPTTTTAESTSSTEGPVSGDGASSPLPDAELNLSMAEETEFPLKEYVHSLMEERQDCSQSAKAAETRRKEIDQELQGIMLDQNIGKFINPEMGYKCYVYSSSSGKKLSPALLLSHGVDADVIERSYEPGKNYTAVKFEELKEQDMVASVVETKKGLIA